MRVVNNLGVVVFTVVQLSGWGDLTDRCRVN